MIRSNAMNQNLLLAALMTILAAPCRADDIGSLRSEPRFNAAVESALTAYRPRDIFAAETSCAILDIKTFQPFSLPETLRQVEPCLRAVSARHALALTAEPGAVAGSKPGAALGIILRTREASALSSGMRDLSHSLDIRGWRLLGHQVAVRRSGQPEAFARSAAQKALDQCVLLAMVREIKTSEDFIRYYGRCITRDPALKVRDIQPWPGQELGVTLTCAASEPETRSLNGIVAVNAGMGPVQIRILARSQN
ncbi:MAG: hypothetical protein WC881_05220 [Elusimicrobiota bacterium]|jgi:hypothetical protein